MAKTGRPSRYRKEFCEQAVKLCKLGAVDKDLADFFGVSEQTLNTWKKKHDEFKRALDLGKAEADNAVEQSLYQRAMGYTHPEEKIFNNQGEIVRTDTTKHYPPDTTACIFWLKNRRPNDWRDKREVTGADGGPLKIGIVEF